MTTAFWKARRDWWPSEFRRMVAIGESTTAGGWSTARERSWVWLLAETISDYQTADVECFNAGIGANVISTRSPCYDVSSHFAASERLEQHVILRCPDLLVISYGLNDARGGTPVELFIEELSEIVQRVRERISPLIVLLGPYFITPAGNDGSGAEWRHGDRHVLSQYNDEIRRYAALDDCLFVDVLEAYAGAEWAVHYDGVHANDIGHRLIANRVFESLAANCSGLALRTREAERTSPRWRDESMLRVIDQRRP